MHTHALRLFTVVLTFCVLRSSAASETANIDEDSLRTTIGTTLERCEELIDISSMTALDSARMLLDSTATLIKTRLGENDTLLAATYYSMSGCYTAKGDFDRAEAIANEALKIWEAVPGETHMQILEGIDLIVECFLQKSDLIRCEQAIERRFEILDGLVRPLSTTETELIVEALNDNGRLRVAQGRYDEAFEEFSRGMNLISDEMIKGPRLRASLTFNIGWLFERQGKLPEAERYVRMGLEATKVAYHPEHPRVLGMSLLMAQLATRQGHFERANVLLDTVLYLAHKLLGPSQPEFYDIYGAKAMALAALDSLELAVEYAERAVAANRNATNYPTARFMGSLYTAGVIAFAAGKDDLAGQRFDELVRTTQTFLRTVFGYASGAQKLNYLKAYPPIIYDYLSGAAMYPGDEMNRGVMNMVLNGKGLAIDALALEQAAAICSADPIIDSLLAEHRAICSEIAQLALSRHSGEQDVQLKLRDLYVDKSRTELELSSLCSHLDFGTDSTGASASAVASVLPERSVLWEFVKYYRTELRGTYWQSDSLGMYYAAITLNSQDHLDIIDLGEAASLDSLVEEYRKVMAEALDAQWTDQAAASLSRYKKVSAALCERLIEPLQSSADGAFQIFVAADGMLNLLPFGTLTKDGERYLIEDYQFVYLTSGRDLLREHHETTGHDAIVVADPDFMIDTSTLPIFAMESASAFISRGNSETPECLASMFSPLPMTRQEGSVVSQLLSQAGAMSVSYFEADQAREGTLKNLRRAPCVLHIATHGYYCAEADRDVLSNPLLRSGLVLAGANRTIGQLDDERPNGEDGILTALEASGLNLVGTDVVVLSACQTGLGEVQSGEGVFGLRRAFQHAGAQSLIMSMFAVPDASTASLMERFYSNWLSGQSKSAALRNASLSILNERRQQRISSHPLFWGGFILVGDPN